MSASLLLVYYYLFLFLLFAPLPSQSQSTLTFDRCFPQTTCTPPRFCISFTESDFTCKPTSDFCFCLPPRFQPCSRPSDCPNPREQCAQDQDLMTFCASTNAINEASFLDFAPPPPSLPSSRLTLDDCARNTDCKSNLRCLFRLPSGALAPCDSRTNPRRRTCVCFPPRRNFKPCFVSTTCPRGEICAETPFARLPLCVAEQAERRWIALSRVRYRQRGARFSLEPCQRDADCARNRRCTSFRGARGGRPLAPCGGSSDFCACYPRERRTNICAATRDCESRDEVCANTPLFQNQSVCVSIRAKEEYEHIEQVKSNDTCPVLLKPQPPREPTMSRMSHASRDVGVVARIQGGLLASDELRKYLVYVDVQNRTTCSAVLIAPKWIMSAAHCGLKVGALVVIGARARFPVPSGEFLSRTVIQRVEVHPKYKPSRRIDDYDVVVAELKDEAPREARFMRLIKDERDMPRAGDRVRAVGYGDSSDMSGEKITSLKQVDLRVFDIERCIELQNRRLPFPQEFDPKLQICVQSERERCGPW